MVICAAAAGRSLKIFCAVQKSKKFPHISSAGIEQMNIKAEKFERRRRRRRNVMDRFSACGPNKTYIRSTSARTVMGVTLAPNPGSPIFSTLCG